MKYNFMASPSMPRLFSAWEVAAASLSYLGFPRDRQEDLDSRKAESSRELVIKSFSYPSAEKELYLIF